MSEPDIKELCSEYNEDMIFATGFDDAIVGVIRRVGDPVVACYDVSKMIEILKKDMTEEEASDYLEFNTIGAYYGRNSPVYLEKI